MTKACDIAVWFDWPATIQVFDSETGEERDYVPECTCHMTYNETWSGDEYYPTEAYTCSRCGGITVTGKPRYCPNCGAKVVEE